MSSHGEVFDDVYRWDLRKGGYGAGSREEPTRDYRALLQHWSNADITAFLPQFQKYGGALQPARRFYSVLCRQRPQAHRSVDAPTGSR